MTITKVTLQLEDFLELERVHSSMEEKMIVYAKNHKDFSVTFEKNIFDNTLTIKTLYLAEHLN